MSLSGMEARFGWLAANIVREVKRIASVVKSFMGWTISSRRTAVKCVEKPWTTFPSLRCEERVFAGKAIDGRAAALAGRQNGLKGLVGRLTDQAGRPKRARQFF